MKLSKRVRPDVEAAPWVVDEIRGLERELDQLTRRYVAVGHQRDANEARLNAAVELLTGIHMLLYPAPFKTPEGRLMVFRPSNPDPHSVLQALSDRIRALPDELRRLGL